MTTSPSRRRGPYAKSATTRAALLDAAVAAFAEAGYNGASLRDIAARANVTQTGLLHHFPSKVALLEAVLDERDRADSAAISEFLGEGSSVIDALVLLVERNQRQRPIIELYTALSAEATSEEHPAHAYFRRRYARVGDQLAADFAKLRDDGMLRDDVSPRSAARITMAALDGLQLQWLLALSDEDAEPVDMVAEARQFLSLLLR
ncbi:TetR family transcriptional regulator [Microbacterium sp. NPDC057659]|uniref:TetR family transcriptional regulator n=1 Tax=Microbacterium sp. NPDC057659 TaxID=3346198 RepID=UPI00366E5F31